MLFLMKQLTTKNICWVWLGTAGNSVINSDEKHGIIGNNDFKIRGY